MTKRFSLPQLLCTALAIPLLLSPVALAQTGKGFSQLDVRPPDAAADLNANLTRLGENPRNVMALIGAGEAALNLDDPRAATGFFVRADEIESGNGRIKAGLGRAMLQLQNPTEALRLFDQAERMRYPAESYISDRALARDLTGDQAGAQRDYQAALRTKPDDAEVLRRYAVSLGISGQVEESEKIITPLLYKNDRAAWRNRAFVLAMNGRVAQARDITQKVMPKPLAEAIQPYMDRMAALTPAQRAAAVHFGNFPSTPAVRMASSSAPTPRAPAGTQAETRAMPSPSSTAAPETRQPVVTRNAAVRPKAEVQSHIVKRPVRIATATPAPAPASTPPQSVTPRLVQGPSDPAPVTTRSPAPATDIPPAAIQPAPVQSSPAPTPPPAATRTLADIIRELDVPDSEKQSSANAVDLAEIMAMQDQKRAAARIATDKAKRDATARAKAEADTRAKALAAEKARLAKNPARNWVQVGTGQSVSALGFTLRGLRKKYDSLAAKDGYTAAWGRTNRLVVGPFASFAKARAYEDALKKSGADAFAWQSDAGEEVCSISAK